MLEFERFKRQAFKPNLFSDYRDRLFRALVHIRGGKTAAQLPDFQIRQLFFFKNLELKNR